MSHWVVNVFWQAACATIWAVLRQMLPPASSLRQHTLWKLLDKSVFGFSADMWIFTGPSDCGPVVKGNLETFYGWFPRKTLKSVYVEEKSERTVEKKYFPGRRLLWSRSRRKHWICRRCWFSHNGSSLHLLLMATFFLEATEKSPALTPVSDTFRLSFRLGPNIW